MSIKPFTSIPQDLRVWTNFLQDTHVAPSTGTVDTAHIINAAVTAVKIADGAITTAKLADSAITNSKLATGAVGTATLADNAVTTAAVANTAIATAKLADAAVTDAKLRDSVATSVIGRAGASNGTPTDITAVADDTFLIRRAGALAWGAIVAADVPASTVTTVAGLPTGIKGRRAFVSDATATTFASIVAGGAANNVPVYYDGTNWRIG